MDNKMNQSDTSAQAAEKKVMPVIELTVSTDKMMAYIRVKPAFEGQEITAEDILSFLESRDITYGVKKRAIRDFCENKRFYAELACAEGSYPIHQQEASIIYRFKTENSAKPKEREDGTVDFRDLGLVQNVTKGAELARIMVPPAGRDGINIYNTPVPHKPAKMPVFPAGKNTVVAEDGLSLLSMIDGCVEFRNKRVEVEDVYTVKGDVDISSGNIDFNGSVRVKGDVRESFTIKAGGDISIGGMAEGVVMESGGCIAISKGMNGMGKGILRAKKDVTGKYFENATIECDGNLYADVLLNCIVKVGGSVILKGQKALLIGGICTAGVMIYANTIGTDNHVRSNITIENAQLSQILSGEESLDSREIEDLEKTLQAAQQTVADLQNQLQVYTAKPDKTEKERTLMKLLLSKKAQNAAQVSMMQRKIDEKREKIEKSKKSTTDFKIIALSRIFPGTKITVGPFTQNLNVEYSNTKVYTDGETIVFAPISSADKLDFY